MLGMQRLLEVAERWEKQEKLKKRLKKGEVTEEDVAKKLRRLDKKRRQLDQHHRELIQSEARRCLGTQAASALEAAGDAEEDLGGMSEEEDEEVEAGDSSYDSQDSFLAEDSDSDEEDMEDGSNDDGALAEPPDAMTRARKAPK